MSNESSLRRSFPRSISASLMAIYYAGVGVVPKVKRKAEKLQSPHNCDACRCDLCLCVDAQVYRIKVFISD